MNREVSVVEAGKQAGKVMFSASSGFMMMWRGVMLLGGMRNYLCVQDS